MSDNQQIILEHLRASRYFKALPEETLRQLLILAELKKFSKDEVLVEQGQQETSVYILVQGSMSILVDGQFIYNLNRRGDIIGEVNFITGKGSGATVIANGDLETIKIASNSLTAIRQDTTRELQNVLYKSFSLILSEKLFLTSEKAKHYETLTQDLQLARDDLEQRVTDRTEDLQKANSKLKEEILERERVELALRRRMQIDKLVTSVSRQFITTPFEDIDAIIHETLESVAECIQVERIYFCSELDGGTEIHHIYEWHVPEINSHRELIEGLLVHHFPAFKETSSQDEGYTYIYDPLFYHQTVVGFFGGDSLRKLEWAEDDYRLLSMVGEIMIGALMRKHAQEQLIQAQAKEAELKMAAAVQQTLIPKQLPIVSNLELSSYYQSASETGGDWYGFMTQIPQHFYILIGDVTGHGAPAAMITANICGACRTLENLYGEKQIAPSPAELLKQLNQSVLAAGSSDLWMTFFIARIDLENGWLTFSNAGHNFPFLIKADGNLKHLLNRNSHLGHPNNHFTENGCQLEAGDLLFFYTDGLIENENPQGKMWGHQRLGHFLKKHHDLSVNGIKDFILNKAFQFFGDQPPEDDLTLVACKVLVPFRLSPITGFSESNN